MGGQGGRVFGRYRLLRPVASDAVTTTYFATAGRTPPRARSSGTGHYAVRIAEQTEPDDRRASDVAQQFLSEARRAGTVDHPTVIRPLDMGLIDGCAFVVTPFIRAVPLGEWLAHGGTADPSVALAMFAQLAGGLDAAHRAGVVHGALNPCTIWVGPSAGGGGAYVAYLMGFGVSTLLREHIAAAPPGPPAEDVLYVAPELLRGEPVTGACDQYALACAVHHTLAGHPPFERETRSKLFGAHLLAPAPEIDVGRVPAATRGALLRALSKEPGERYPTCGALVHDALPDGQADPPPIAGRAGVRATVRHAGAPRAAVAVGPRAWWSLALVLLVVAAAGVWLALRLGGPQPDGATTQVSARAETGQPDVGRPAWSVPVTTTAVTQLTVLDDAVVAVDQHGVTALEAGDGSVRWKRDTGGTVEVVVGAGVLAYGAPSLTAVDHDTGAVRWVAESAGSTRSLTAAGRTIVGVRGDAARSEVVAVGDEGDERWRVRVAGAGNDGNAVSERGGGAATHVAAAASDDQVFLLHGTRLGAVDPSTATRIGADGDVVGGDQRSWRREVDGAWPVVTAVDGGVIVATAGGSVCRYAADDGSADWCERVPGLETEQPRLFAVGDRLVVATSAAVVALDGASGTRDWQVAPGSATNQVAASASWVAIADGAAVRVLDTASGAVALESPDVGKVTALALDSGRLFVATVGGDLLRVDLHRR